MSQPKIDQVKCGKTNNLIATNVSLGYVKEHADI